MGPLPSRAIALFILVAMLLGIAPSAQAAEEGWSELLDGAITGTPLLVEDGLILVTHNGTYLLDLDGNLEWRAPVNGTFGAIRAGDLAIVPADHAGLVALDIATGSEVWRWDCAGGACSSRPTIDDGQVLIGTSGHDSTNPIFAVLDAQDGSELWSRTLPAEVYFGGVATSGDVVFVPLTRDVPQEYPTDTGLIAFDRDGELWRFETIGSIVSRPLVIGDLLVVSTKADGLLGIDIPGGFMRWKLAMFTSTSSPVLSGDRWFVGTGFLGGGFGEVVVIQPGTVPAIMRQPSVPGPIQSDPVPDGRGGVYVSRNSAVGAVHHIDAEGRLIGTVVPEPYDYILGSPVISGTDLYVGSDSGYLHRIPLALLEPGSYVPADEEKSPGLGVVVALLVVAATGVFLIILRRHR